MFTANSRMLTILIVTALAAAAAQANPLPITIARQGQAQHPVIVSEQASEQSRIAAEELAAYLGRISGGTFAVQVGSGTSGLAVGAFDEFPELGLNSLFDPSDPLRREEYVLRSHGGDGGGLYLIGATPAAARLAVWDLLYRLGHRQFLPADHWEIVPSSPDITVAVDVIDKPDWPARRIYPGGSRWRPGVEPWDNWRIRNRNLSSESFSLHTGHVYGSIVRANREIFDQNPQYFGLVDGQRYTGSNAKFCISNEELRQLVVDYAIGVMQANPDRQSISMDPSDGGHWCECEPCIEMGSVSDRVVTLANQVAEAINNLGLGTKYVGIYAYASHSPPPTINVHPRVVVSVATSFIRGGYTADQLVEQWAAKGAIIGIREYYSITTWNADLPGRARAADIPYLTRTVRHFHENGARFNIANASHSWGAYGLGFYLLAQMLWDVDQTDQVEVLFDDYLERAFGPVREPIEKYHRLIYRFDESSPRPMLSEHLVGAMYRHLAEARQLAKASSSDADLLARIDDLILYTRYVELYRQTQEAGGSDKQALGEELLRHIHTMHDALLVLFWDRSDRRRLPMPRESIPQGEALQALWTIDRYTDEQIDDMVAKGIANNKLLDFEPVSFSKDLVPAAEALGFSPQPLSHLRALRSRQVFHTWLDEPGTITLRVRGGMIAKYRDRGNVRITLHSPLDEVGDGIAFDDSVEPDGEEHTVTLTTPHAGLHWIEVLDGGDMTSVQLADESLPFTILVEQGETFNHVGRWAQYFYVPRGTQVVAGFTSSASGRLRNAAGEVIYRFDEMDGAGHFKVPVPPGQDGQVWRIEQATGRRFLMTVPPYLAPSPGHLLLPREVVEADRR